MPRRCAEFLQILPAWVSSPAGKFSLGEMMKRILAIAVVLAATVAIQPGWTAEKAAAKAKASCPPVTAREAEAAIRYMTELGIASNSCTSIAIYADFRTRNRDPIVDYQKALIAHLHGNAAFDRWN